MGPLSIVTVCWRILWSMSMRMLSIGSFVWSGFVCGIVHLSFRRGSMKRYTIMCRARCGIWRVVIETINVTIKLVCTVVDIVFWTVRWVTYLSHFIFEFGRKHAGILFAASRWSAQLMFGIGIIALRWSTLLGCARWYNIARNRFAGHKSVEIHVL